MVNDKVREVHVSQLMLYRDDRLGEVLDQAHKEQLMYSDTGYEAQKFKKFLLVVDQIQVLTLWKGLKAMQILASEKKLDKIKITIAVELHSKLVVL
jgi:hypothetical protein